MSGGDACRNMLRLRFRVIADRQRTAARLRRAVSALGPVDFGSLDATDPVDYALLHHLYVAVRVAAERRDVDTAAAALTRWRARSALDRTRGAVVVGARDCLRQDVDGVHGPVYLLGPAGPPEPDRVVPPLADGLRAVAAAGFGALADIGTGVLVHLGPVAAGSSPVSYTLSFLPCTAALQWPATAAALGELLVHEAAHSWLNECLEGAGIRLPAEPLVMSPWKGVPRPPAGILHAAFAFSTVICYLASYPGRGDRPVGRIGTEQEIMADQRASIDQVIDMVPSDGIRQMVAGQVALALASGR